MARNLKLNKLTSPFRVIPGYVNPDCRIVKVEFPGFEPEEVTYWQNEGFYQAIALPYEHRKIEGIDVLVIKPLLRSNSAAQKYGFNPAVMIVTPKASEIWRSVRESIQNCKSSSYAT